MNITWNRRADPLEIELSIKFTAEDFDASFSEHGFVEALIEGFVLSASRTRDSVGGMAAQLNLTADLPEQKGKK